MLNFENIELDSSLPVLLTPLPATPRMALAVTFDGGVRREAQPALAKLAGRLLLKGTEQRSAEALATELDERGIEIREMTMADCSVLLLVFLNRDLPYALEILRDILFHSTFADFEKEREKLAGEIQACLDYPAEVAQDLLVRTLFAGHPYGHSGQRMLEALPSLSASAVQQWYADGLNPRQMNVTLVGDFEPDAVIPRLEETFSDLVSRLPASYTPELIPRADSCVVTQARKDAQQAQIYQGWYAPAIGTVEQAAMMTMNTILGAAGLSSRLFTELRDKQGLAYSVRSQYVPMRQTGEFIVSIGTSPENIERARNGFSEQILRMQAEPITQEELDGAKGRMRGTWVLAHETTCQYCLDMAISHIHGLGPDYSRQLLQNIEEVTVSEVQTAAQKITPPSVTAIVAREEALLDFAKQGD